MTERVAVVGSRAFSASQLVVDYVRSLPQGTAVVSGGARGVDTFAAEAARTCGLEVSIHEAAWKTLGRKAGPIRNAEIVASADRVTAFWDGHSRGTLSTVLMAIEAGLPVTIFGSTGELVPLEQALEAAESAGVGAGFRKARSQNRTSDA